MGIVKIILAGAGYFSNRQKQLKKGGIMDIGHENEILLQMQEVVRELVNTCQDLELLDLIYKILLLR